MARPTEKNAADLSAQAIALAEQLGRIAGTIEGTAESWMNGQQLTDQLARVRDGANQMLEGLMARARASKGGKKKAAPAARTRQADPARAPGKRRRKPGPSMKGVKKSDERIPKMRTAAAARQRRKSYA
jgi:hypothetical protein